MHAAWGALWSSDALRSEIAELVDVLADRAARGLPVTLLENHLASIDHDDGTLNVSAVVAAPKSAGRPRPRAPSGPDHVWAIDFVFDACADGRPLKCPTVVDEWTRECVAAERQAPRRNASIRYGHERFWADRL
jgi:transposase InsO family protein